MYCGCDFDPNKNRYREGSNLANTFERILADFTVRCPNCGIAFMSEELRMFGLFTYYRLWIFYGLLVLGMAVFGVWMDRIDR